MDPEGARRAVEGLDKMVVNGKPVFVTMTSSVSFVVYQLTVAFTRKVLLWVSVVFASQQIWSPSLQISWNFTWEKYSQSHQKSYHGIQGTVNLSYLDSMGPKGVCNLEKSLWLRNCIVLAWFPGIMQSSLAVWKLCRRPDPFPILYSSKLKMKKTSWNSGLTL